MSRKNKVAPDHYKSAGRLSVDDIARERVRQTSPRNRPAAGGSASPQAVKPGVGGEEEVPLKNARNPATPETLQL